MKALQFIGGRVLVGDRPRPHVECETLVRVVKSGICNTDLEIIRGYAGFEGTLGHEFVGVVESSGDSGLVGKRVVGEINAGCGTCGLCRAGDPRHCPGRTVLGIVGRDGAHAEYLSLPGSNLLVVPDGVSDEEAVFAEPLAAAVGITEQVAVGAGQSVAVIGDGKLGILCALSLSAAGADVTLIGRHRSKLDIAASRGVETSIAGDGGVMPNAFDIVVEASGSERGFSDAVHLVRPRGKIVLKSTVHGTPNWEPSRIVVDEITVVGSRCGRFAPALELLRSRAIDVKPLISEEFRLADGVAAIEAAGKPGVLKVLLNAA